MRSMSRIFFAGLFMEERQEKSPEREREAAILPVRDSRLWPSDPGGAGEIRQRQSMKENRKNKRERIREPDSWKSWAAMSG